MPPSAMGVAFHLTVSRLASRHFWAGAGLRILAHDQPFSVAGLVSPLRLIGIPNQFAFFPPHSLGQPAACLPLNSPLAFGQMLTHLAQ